MKQVSTHEAKTHLSRLLVLAEAGEEVIVCKGKQPVARLVPFRPAKRKRPPVGKPTSKRVKYTPDCFSPLSDEELEQWGW